MRGLILAAAALALAACTHAPPAGSAPQNPEQATEADTCGMAAYQRFVGGPVSAIDRATLPPGTRVITPDMAVTMDFRAERLNIMVGADGRVGSLRCF